MLYFCVEAEDVSDDEDHTLSASVDTSFLEVYQPRKLHAYMCLRRHANVLLRRMTHPKMIPAYGDRDV